MKPEDIHVGDRLRIRMWDDMAEEFGIEFDDIRTPDASFTDRMRDLGLCGSVFTVSSIYDDNGTTFYRSMEGVEIVENGWQDHWYIAASMLEPYYGNDDLIDLPEEEFESDLISFMKEGIA